MTTHRPGPAGPVPASARRLAAPAAVLVCLAIAAAVLAATAPARAVLSIDVTRGQLQPVPIAIPYFTGGAGTGTLAQDIPDVIANNLGSSGLFRPVDRAAFVTASVDVEAVPRFQDWRAAQADALVTGSVTDAGGGQVTVAFRLWDTVAQEEMLARQFTTPAGNWRRIAHIVSDLVYQRITGESGYFDTRIVFVAEEGPKNARRKRLAIMDQDGANMRYLTDGTELVLTPRFSPTSQTVAYMSYGGQSPQVYRLNLETGERTLLGDFPGMTFSPRFSPDGRQVIMSLQEGGNANIYTMDLASRQTRRVTSSPSIDTSPSFSPDGSQIVFESDRGGSQQLYVMNADGSAVRRISYGDGRYSTPVWSPRGDLIAFTKQVAGRFAIGVMRPDGSGERILTEGYHNEGPTFAPNGRVLMFFRESRGAQGGPSLWTIDVTGYNERRVQMATMASDPAWSPLLD